jgi:ribonuclease-3
MRAAIVSRRSLSCLAQRLGLGEFLLLGKGEDLGRGRQKTSILAGAYEAVIGAVYRDGGYGEALSLLRKHFANVLEDSRAKGADHDFKSRLQVLTQSLFKTVPEYVLVNESGPAHSRVFEVELKIGTKLRARGRARTKKEAEQRAAQEVLEHLQGTPPT